jgi:hypothetical protein
LGRREERRIGRGGGADGYEPPSWGFIGGSVLREGIRMQGSKNKERKF